MAENQNKQIGLSEALSIGIGGMVGGGIFAVLGLAAITVGSLDFKDIATAQDYALAEAAKPMLGQMGFTIITIAALISTFSAINASLYGGSRVNYEIAEDKELPLEFTRKLWKQPVGVIVTAIATLILVNTLKLESISTAGSVGFLLIFTVVNLVGYKKPKEIGAKKWIPLLGSISCSLALCALLFQHYSVSKTDIYIAIGLVFFCFLLEYTYQKTRKK